MLLLAHQPDSEAGKNFPIMLLLETAAALARSLFCQVLMYRLYLEYDPTRSGSLSLPELSKFLCHVAQLHSQLQFQAVKQRHVLLQVQTLKWFLCW